MKNSTIRLIVLLTACTLFLAMSVVIAFASPEADAAWDYNYWWNPTFRTVYFGRFEQDGNKDNGPEPIEWYVIEETASKYLLLSKYALVTEPYYTTRAYIPYEKSVVRSWLVNDFYSCAFTPSEKLRITSPIPDNSPEKTTEFVQENRPFILSVKQASELLDYATLKCAPVKAAKDAYRNEENGNTWWWLSTNGSDEGCQIYVGNKGNIDYGGNPTGWNGGCIRPAIYLVKENQPQYGYGYQPPVFVR